MDRRAEWTREGQDDFAAAFVYLSDLNEPAAVRFQSEIEKCIQLLLEFPMIGAVYEPASRQGIRQTMCFGYRVFYRIVEDGATILILTIRHPSRREPRFR